MSDQPALPGLEPAPPTPAKHDKYQSDLVPKWMGRGGSSAQRMRAARGLHPTGKPLNDDPELQCKGCIHVHRHTAAKTFLKCHLDRAHWTHGPGTDIRLKWRACSKRPVIVSEALLSADRQHRYWLRRSWDGSKSHLAWIMLNPSTADADTDDATIRKCMRFAHGWGFGGIEVVNVYNYRATDPKELWYNKDLMGEWTHSDIAEHLVQRHIGGVIAAWGTHARIGDVHGLATELGRFGVGVSSLGTNANGSPKHPLYLPGATRLRPWAAD